MPKVKAKPLACLYYNTFKNLIQPLFYIFLLKITNYFTFKSIVAIFPKSLFMITIF